MSSHRKVNYIWGSSSPTFFLPFSVPPSLPSFLNPSLQMSYYSFIQQMFDFITHSQFRETTDSINQHNPKPHGVSHYGFFFLLKGNPQIKVWSQELCGREDTQQKVADMHRRIKMLSWGNYKRDEIRDKKLGRKRKSGWGSRYSVPAEETAWQIRGPKDAMGRRKGWRWGFLEEAPQTTLRSPGFITATTETIQGDHQKAQKGKRLAQSCCYGHWVEKGQRKPCSHHLHLFSKRGNW